jgi:hypothetical protein
MEQDIAIIRRTIRRDVLQSEADFVTYEIGD